MYRCADGWVALAALEPHFAQRIAQVAELAQRDGSLDSMHHRSSHAALEHFFAPLHCEQLAAMAAQSDIPLHVIPAQDK
jgi:crotonobetainyl-CoA:carnitine CoA-transferase CaiB-like acyl-CoA transferase